MESNKLLLVTTPLIRRKDFNTFSTLAKSLRKRSETEKSVFNRSDPFRLDPYCFVEFCTLIPNLPSLSARRLWSRVMSVFRVKKLNAKLNQNRPKLPKWSNAEHQSNSCDGYILSDMLILDPALSECRKDCNIRFYANSAFRFCTKKRP